MTLENGRAIITFHTHRVFKRASKTVIRWLQNRKKLHRSQSLCHKEQIETENELHIETKCAMTEEVCCCCEKACLANWPTAVTKCYCLLTSATSNKSNNHHRQIFWLLVDPINWYCSRLSLSESGTFTAAIIQLIASDKSQLCIVRALLAGEFKEQLRRGAQQSLNCGAEWTPLIDGWWTLIWDEASIGSIVVPGRLSRAKNNPKPRPKWRVAISNLITDQEDNVRCCEQFVWFRSAINCNANGLVAVNGNLESFFCRLIRARFESRWHHNERFLATQ